MRTILLALLLTWGAVGALKISDDEYRYQFAIFQLRYGKIYSREEFSKRYSIFKSNYDLITQHNMEQHSWSVAVNQYADMSWDEFKSQKLGYKRITSTSVPRKTVNLTGLVTVANNVDWVIAGAVTAVKDQGQCGSCWAFSSTGSIEGAVYLKTGRLTSLSEQQLMDCSSAYGNEGCNGGLMDDAFDYVIANGGLCSEASYPYSAEEGSCRSCTQVSRITSYVDVAQEDEDALAAAVNLQPVSVAVEADQSGFQFYSGGVFDGTCGTSLDHGVLIVGYGVDSSTGLKYWKVKNSWGESWGDAGYIKLIRKGGSTTGQCGIAMEPSYPVAA